MPGPVPTSPANRDYKPGFAAALMLKDLKLAQDAARPRARRRRWARERRQSNALFNAQGHAGADFSGIIQPCSCAC